MLPLSGLHLTTPAGDIIDKGMEIVKNIVLAIPTNTTIAMSVPDSTEIRSNGVSTKKTVYACTEIIQMSPCF